MYLDLTPLNGGCCASWSWRLLAVWQLLLHLPRFSLLPSKAGLQVS